MEVGPGIKVGAFMATLFDFVVIAFVIFLMVKAINRLKRREEAKPAAPAEVPPDVKLLAEIRDLLRGKNGPVG
jgi:large conductance mechanosensitive channel